MTNTLSDSISISYPGSGGKAKYQQPSLSTCGDWQNPTEPRTNDFLIVPRLMTLLLSA